MPPRMYDYDQILKTYDELQNINEVSKKLNVPWRSVYNVVKGRTILPYTRKTVPFHIEKQAIGAYIRLKNINEVAVEVNITRQLAQYLVNKHNGNCNNCGALIKPGETHCSECRKKSSERVKKIRKERQRLGLCRDCDKVYEPPSRVFCTEHRLKHQKLAATRPSAIKRRTRKKGGVVDIKLKLQNIITKYGENGVTCFQQADGRCFICQRQHGEEAQIHIHHINCNENDHSLKNLICLCYEHHIALHAILRGPNVIGFLDWFRSKYVNQETP